MARTIVYEGLRWSLVPWLRDWSDLRALGVPDVTVSVGNHEIVHGFNVVYPFGKDTDMSLIVHAVKGNGNDGGRITLAISNEVFRRDEPKERITKASFYPPKPETEDDSA